MGKLFIVTFFLFATFIQEKRDVIIWNEKRPLTWNDFKGTPQKRFAAASTVYRIEKDIVQHGNTATVKIEAVFFCKDSWKKEAWISESVLGHEQKHFDIVELYCRKLRKLIKSQNFSSYDDLVTKANAFLEKTDKEMDAYQDEYDEKTDGSMDGDRQKVWNKKIQAELDALKAFGNPVLEISL